MLEWDAGRLDLRISYVNMSQSGTSMMMLLQGLTIVVTTNTVVKCTDDPYSICLKHATLRVMLDQVVAETMC